MILWGVSERSGPPHSPIPQEHTVNLTIIILVLATWCAASIITAAAWAILRSTQKTRAARAARPTTTTTQES